MEQQEAVSLDLKEAEQAFLEPYVKVFVAARTRAVDAERVLMDYCAMRLCDAGYPELVPHLNWDARRVEGRLPEAVPGGVVQ